MNFIQGKILKKNSAFYFIQEGFKLAIVKEMADKIAPYAGEDVLFGVRPEDIYDKLFATIAPPEQTVSAQVELVEPMGSETFLYLKIGGCCDFVARVGAHNKPKMHDTIELVFDMKKIHFFDQATEKTIV
ncbi:MAG: TOBE domain-containing protein [Candidatus Omnitrophica bacterium]|nr:TOBE domain-containing protein [Candidatus Omnitrophota bacterium]